MTIPQQEQSADTINCHLAEGCNVDNFHVLTWDSNLGPPDYESTVLTIRPPTPVNYSSKSNNNKGVYLLNIVTFTRF